MWRSTDLLPVGRKKGEVSYKKGRGGGVKEGRDGEETGGGVKI